MKRIHKISWEIREEETVAPKWFQRLGIPISIGSKVTEMIIVSDNDQDLERYLGQVLKGLKDATTSDENNLINSYVTKRTVKLKV